MDYEGVPWGDEDEDMRSVVGRSRGVGRRSWTEAVESSVGRGGEVMPIPSLQRLFDRSYG
jgi:hypothetical protein